MSIGALNLFVDGNILTIEKLAASGPRSMMEFYLRKLDTVSREKGYSFELVFSTSNEERQSFSIAISIPNRSQIDDFKKEIERFSELL